MPKKRFDNYAISETGNWNVAADFSKFKIMQPLYLCDVYENLAKFGYDSILDQLMNFNMPIDSLKITGFERLVHELMKLIKNSMFAMKRKGTKKELEDFEETLKKALEVLPMTYKIKTDLKKNKQLHLIPEKYNKVLGVVLQVKSKINEPLNKNHLIFTDREEYDPEAHQKQIAEELSTLG